MDLQKEIEVVQATINQLEAELKNVLGVKAQINVREPEILKDLSFNRGQLNVLSAVLNEQNQETARLKAEAEKAMKAKESKGDEQSGKAQPVSAKK